MSVDRTGATRRPGAEESRWTAGPTTPVLAAREVHVWRADLQSVSDEVLANLSPDDRERASGILSTRKAQLWARSRGVLRELLGRYLDLDPSKLRFLVGPNGKPKLAPVQGADDPPPGELHFNLSHSGTVALYTFTRDGPVGIDVELAGRQLDHVAIAGRVFGAREAQPLRALPPSERECEFLRAWVRREAVLKCRGTGSEGIGVHADARAREPWTAQLDLGALALGAVALDRRARDVRYWSYPAALEHPQCDRLSDPLAADGGGHGHGHAAAMRAE